MKRIKSNSSNSSNTPLDYDWSSQFVLKIKRPPNIGISLNININNIKYSDSPSRPSQSLVNTEKYCKLIENKDQIGKLINMDKILLWKKWSRLVNPYEKISNVSNIKIDKCISRAFFKLYEMLLFINQDTIENSLHLCEAPGGFVKATIKLFPEIKWKAQSLYEGGGKLDVSNDLDISNWIYNGNGDITVLDNILVIKNLFPDKKWDLITGDGGFDVSNDPNNQEQMSFKLIYSEILTALHYQEKGGTFICKIFDFFTRPTYQIILLLTKYYNSIKIIKPRTSRFTNSEKYIIAEGFMGINKDDLSKLDNILKNWVRPFCRDIGINIKDKIIDLDYIKEYNSYMAIKQSWYIHQAIFYSTKNEEDKSQELKAIQNKRASLFCESYNLIDNIEKCPHTYVTKIKFSKVGTKFIFKCNNCLKMLINY